MQNMDTFLIGWVATIDSSKSPTPFDIFLKTVSPSFLKDMKNLKDPPVVVDLIPVIIFTATLTHTTMDYTSYNAAPSWDNSEQLYMVV